MEEESFFREPQEELTALKKIANRLKLLNPFELLIFILTFFISQVCGLWRYLSGWSPTAEAENMRPINQFTYGLTYIMLLPLQMLRILLMNGAEYVPSASMFLVLGFAVFASSKDIGLAVAGQFLMTGVLGSPLVVFALTVLPVAFISGWVMQLKPTVVEASPIEFIPLYPIDPNSEKQSHLGIAGWSFFSISFFLASMYIWSYIFSAGVTFPVNNMVWPIIWATVCTLTCWFSAKHVFSQSPRNPYAILTIFFGVAGAIFKLFFIPSGTVELSWPLLAIASGIFLLFTFSYIQAFRNGDLPDKEAQIKNQPGENLLRRLEISLIFVFLFLAFLGVVAIIAKTSNFGPFSGVLNIVFNAVINVLGYSGFQIGLQWLSSFSIATFSISCFFAYELLKIVTKSVPISNTRNTSNAQTTKIPGNQTTLTKLLKFTFIFGLMLPLLFVPNIPKSILYICLVQAVVTPLFSSIWIRLISNPKHYRDREIFVMAFLCIIFTCSLLLMGIFDFKILSIWTFCGAGAIEFLRNSIILNNRLDYLELEKQVNDGITRRAQEDIRAKEDIKKGPPSESGARVLEAKEIKAPPSPSPLIEPPSDEKNTRRVFNEIIRLAEAKDQAQLTRFLSKEECPIDLCLTGETPVSFLGRQGDIQIVEWLVNHFNAGLNQAILGVTHYAAACEDRIAKARYLSYMESLIMRGASLNYAVRGAARGGDASLVAYLRDRGANINHAYWGAEEGAKRSLAESLKTEDASEYAIRALIAIKDFDSIKSFMDSDTQKIAPEEKSENILTFRNASKHTKKHTKSFIQKIIYHAAVNGRFDFMDELINSCADVEKEVLIPSAIVGAAEGGHFPTVLKLLRQSKDPKSSSECVLLGAAKGGHIDQLAYLMVCYRQTFTGFTQALKMGGHIRNKRLILRLLNNRTLSENKPLHGQILRAMDFFYKQKANKDIAIGQLSCNSRTRQIEFVLDPSPAEKKEESVEEEKSSEAFFKKGQKDLFLLLARQAQDKTETLLTSLYTENLSIDYHWGNMTLVRFFAARGDIETVVWLIKNCGAGLNQAVLGISEYAVTCKNSAVKAHCLSFMYCLIRSGASLSYAVQGAAKGGDSGLVEYLLTQGAGLDYATSGAVEGAHIKLLKRLIGRKDSFYYPVRDYVNRLLAATSRQEVGKEDFMTVLRLGEGPQIKTLVQTFLYSAMERGKFSLVESLITWDSELAATESPEKVLTFLDGSKHTQTFMHKVIHSAAASRNFYFMAALLNRCDAAGKESLFSASIAGAAEAGDFTSVNDLLEGYSGKRSPFPFVAFGAARGGHIDSLLSLVKENNIPADIIVQGLAQGEHIKNRPLIQRLLENLHPGKLKAVLVAINEFYVTNNIGPPFVSPIFSPSEHTRSAIPISAETVGALAQSLPTIFPVPPTEKSSAILSLS